MIVLPMGWTSHSYEVSQGCQRRLSRTRASAPGRRQMATAWHTLIPARVRRRAPMQDVVLPMGWTNNAYARTGSGRRA